MAVRTWQVHPDQLLPLRDGREIPVVSRDAFHAALTDVAAIMDRAGGVVSIQSLRSETDLPGERVTTALFFEWKDRTDARQAPEPVHAPPPVPEPQQATIFTGTEPVVEAFFPPETPQEPVAQQAPPVVPVGDGLDETLLPDEDLSSIPTGT